MTRYGSLWAHSFDELMLVADRRQPLTSSGTNTLITDSPSLKARKSQLLCRRAAGPRLNRDRNALRVYHKGLFIRLFWLVYMLRRDRSIALLILSPRLILPSMTRT